MICPPATASTRSIVSAHGMADSATKAAAAANHDPALITRTRISERLSEADEPCRPLLAGQRMDLCSDVHPQRPDRRFVPQARAYGGPHVIEADVGNARVHV